MAYVETQANLESEILAFLNAHKFANTVLVLAILVLLSAKMSQDTLNQIPLTSAPLGARLEIVWLDTYWASWIGSLRMGARLPTFRTIRKRENLKQEIVIRNSAQNKCELLSGLTDQPLRALVWGVCYEIEFMSFHPTSSYGRNLVSTDLIPLRKSEEGLLGAGPFIVLVKPRTWVVFLGSVDRGGRIYGWPLFIVNWDDEYVAITSENVSRLGQFTYLWEGKHLGESACSTIRIQEYMGKTYLLLLMRHGQDLSTAIGSVGSLGCMRMSAGCIDSWICLCKPSLASGCVGTSDNHICRSNGACCMGRTYPVIPNAEDRHQTILVTWWSLSKVCDHHFLLMQISLPQSMGVGLDLS